MCVAKLQLGVPPGKKKERKKDYALGRGLRKLVVPPGKQAPRADGTGADTGTDTGSAPAPAPAPHRHQRTPAPPRCTPTRSSPTRIGISPAFAPAQALPLVTLVTLVRLRGLAGTRRHPGIHSESQRNKAKQLAHCSKRTGLDAGAAGGGPCPACADARALTCPQPMCWRSLVAACNMPDRHSVVLRVTAKQAQPLRRSPLPHSHSLR